MKNQDPEKIKLRNQYKRKMKTRRMKPNSKIKKKKWKTLMTMRGMRILFQIPIETEMH